LLDDLVPAPAQVPDEIVDFIAEAATHLLTHGFLAREAAGGPAYPTQAMLTCRIVNRC
jgi:hypothetical protein